MILLLGSFIFYYFNSYVPLIFMTDFVFIWAVLRTVHRKKLTDLVEIQIPPYIWQAFYQRHPHLSLSSQQIIEEGFKDYFTLHIRHKKAYAMPSHAVDALWHLLLEEYPYFYQHLCKITLRSFLRHKPHDQNPTAEQKAAQQQQLMNTWCAACQIHDLDPQNTPTLPRLFQVDAQVKWENGLHFKLPLLLAMYAQSIQGSSDTSPVNHSSSCSSATSCSGSSSDVGHSHSGHDSNADGGSDSSSSCSSCSSCGGGGD